MQSFTKKLGCLALIIIISTSAFAGVIKGRVTDARTGEPLAGATVELVNNDTRLFSTVNLDGSYIIKNVAAGNYSLSIKSLGYNTVKNHAIEVKNGAGDIVFNTTLQSEASMLDEVTIVTGNKESDHA